MEAFLNNVLTRLSVSALLIVGASAGGCAAALGLFDKALSAVEKVRLKDLLGTGAASASVIAAAAASGNCGTALGLNEEALSAVEKVRLKALLAVRGSPVKLASPTGGAAVVAAAEVCRDGGLATPVLSAAGDAAVAATDLCFFRAGLGTAALSAADVPASEACLETDLKSAAGAAVVAANDSRLVTGLKSGPPSDGTTTAAAAAGVAADDVWRESGSDTVPSASKAVAANEIRRDTGVKAGRLSAGVDSCLGTELLRPGALVALAASRAESDAPRNTDLPREQKHGQGHCF